jgi:hypothetical protein
MAASGITKGEHCPGWGEGESELQRFFFFFFGSGNSRVVYAHQKH